MNTKWKETAEQFNGKADMLTSDADRTLRNALIDKVLNHQQCVNHVIRDVGYSLWKAGLLKKGEKRDIHKA